MFDSILGYDFNELTEGQTRISCPLQLSNCFSAVDTLDVSLYLDCQNSSIFDRLSNAKSNVQETMSVSAPFNFGFDEFFKWNIHRMGTKLYPYVLSSGDIFLLLSPRDSESIPNCKIEIGSMSCQEDFYSYFSKIIQWLQVYGFTVKKEIVSRIDLAVDCIGTDISDLPVYHPGFWVSRARKYSVYYHGRSMTGIQLGSGSIVLRIYDKSSELRRNKVKEAFFRHKWGLLSDDSIDDISVTRVEFQFRRDVLKEFDFDLNTVEDLRNNLDSLWQYAVIKWARLSSHKVDSDNRHQDRAKIHSFWLSIQSVVFVLPQTVARRVKKIVVKDIDHLKNQARGCLLSVAAAAGHDSDDYFGIISTVTDCITNVFSEYMIDKKYDFLKKFEQRQRECYVGF